MSASLSVPASGSPDLRLSVLRDRSASDAADRMSRQNRFRLDIISDQLAKPPSQILDGIEKRREQFFQRFDCRFNGFEHRISNLSGDISDLAQRFLILDRKSVV